MSIDRRALVVSGLAVAASPALARAAGLPAAEGDMVMGNPAAPGQLIVYASASCSHCAHWWTHEMPELKKTLFDTGKARLVFREYLTEPNEFAAAAYLLARRVGPARYFEVLTAVFARRQAIFDSGELWEGLLAIGKSFGLTEAQFTAAQSDKAALERVNARYRRGIGEGVMGTPTFFANGAEYDGEVANATLIRLFSAAKG